MVYPGRTAIEAQSTQRTMDFIADYLFNVD
jgi:hypothetical protein